MRALTTGETKVLAGAQRSNYLRVRLANAAATLVDLTTLAGVNWVRGAEWGESVDSYVATATVRLAREHFQLSLANLMGASKLNIGGAQVELAREVRIDTATMPLGVAPAAADWHNVFAGYVDEMDWGSNPIVLTARDKAGQLLQDVQIETERRYGVWAASRAILLGTVTIPSGNPPNGQTTPATQYWKCTTAGTTGATEPAWPSNPASGATVTDGGVTWTYQLAVAWSAGSTRAVGAFCSSPTNALQYWQCTAITTGVTSGSNPFPAAPTQGQVVVDGGVTWTYYASLAGTPAETVIQSVLNDTAGVGIVPLQVPAPTTWYMGPYTQARDKLFTAVTALAEMIGWDMRYAWNGTEAGGDFQLTLKAVNRATPASVWTFKGSDYFDAKRVLRSIHDIRNAVLVAFYDAEHLDPTTLQPLRSTVIASDATSISKYRRRFMEIAEPATSAVSTAAIATLLAQAALIDLKEPLIAAEVTLPYFWALQPNDYVTLKANGTHFDADQNVAVVSIKHAFSVADAGGKGTERTTIGVRALPTMGHQKHLDKEGGVTATNLPRLNPATASSIQVSPTIAGGRLSFPLPPTAGGKFTVAELHVSTANGFTPDSTTLKDWGLKNRFELGDLTPGTTYYAVVLLRDQRGNVSGASAQQTFTAAYVTGAGLSPGMTVAGEITRSSADANSGTDGGAVTFDTTTFTTGATANLSAGSITPTYSTLAKVSACVTIRSGTVATIVTIDSSCRAQLTLYAAGTAIARSKWTRAEDASDGVAEITMTLERTIQAVATRALTLGIQVVNGAGTLVTVGTTNKVTLKAASATSAGCWLSIAPSPL